MQFLCFDVETTGIPRFDLPADDPSQPRVVELAAALVGFDGRVFDEYESIVRPDGWTIPEEVAAKSHGISTAKALQLGRPIAEVVERFDAMALRAELLVAFNLRFDDKLIRGERRRLGRPDGFGKVPVFCCMRGCTPICRIAPTRKMSAAGITRYKLPKLSEAVVHSLGRHHEGAHRAMADVRATIELFLTLRSDPEFWAAGSDFASNDVSRLRAATAASPHIPPLEPAPMPAISDSII